MAKTWGISCEYIVLGMDLISDANATMYGVC